MESGKTSARRSRKRGCGGAPRGSFPTSIYISAPPIIASWAIIASVGQECRYLAVSVCSFLSILKTIRAFFWCAGDLSGLCRLGVTAADVYLHPRGLQEPLSVSTLTEAKQRKHWDTCGRRAGAPQLLEDEAECKRRRHTHTLWHQRRQAHGGHYLNEVGIQFLRRGDGYLRDGLRPE